MDSQKQTWIISLGDTSGFDVNVVGGKAASLAKMISIGICVPPGFCLAVSAYRQFLASSNLSAVIQMELGKKPLSKMRWEEIWDAALRIRSAFLRAPVPPEIVKAVDEALLNLNPQHPLAVRSSGLGEDSIKRSFAGLHESIINVQGKKSVLRAIQTVWASLWSDAALLYRRELSLDPLQSGMAIVVQEMVSAQKSGVAFSRDPRNQSLDREIVEAVPGPCSNLVDGFLEPDRWILKHSSGEIIEWHAGKRNTAPDDIPLLSEHDLRRLHAKLGQVEELFERPPDIEWAEQDGKLSVLQARSITSGLPDPQADERRWYLTLRPKFAQLRQLAEKVSGRLIPELERLGKQLAEEDIESQDDHCLADCINARLSTLKYWREVYKKEFIPLAHGVRYLGAYYNDTLQPKDPYEFLFLLDGIDFLATHRNTALQKLAQQVQQNCSLRKKLNESATICHSMTSWNNYKKEIASIQGGPEFLAAFEQFLVTFMDIAYNGERLAGQPSSLLYLIYQLAATSNNEPATQKKNGKAKAQMLEQLLIKAVGRRREQEAKEVIAIGRLSWRLRDDDNILLGRIESQFLRALLLGADRLRAAGRLTGKPPVEKSAALVVQALQDSTLAPVHLDEHEPEPTQRHSQTADKPRQLIGQPASPGLADGSARVVNGVKDFLNFQRGEILVCESIQPTMTQLVPLASAIVERRGGMLIHGAIIARELGIPCVNGISNATNVICDGDYLSVDGHLGIVTFGIPDFELEDHVFSQKK